VSSRTDEYRRRAQQCLTLARKLKSTRERSCLLEMARVWSRLAEEPRPVVQQQQQIQPKDDDDKAK
jgi:hypothetical protein